MKITAMDSLGIIKDYYVSSDKARIVFKLLCHKNTIVWLYDDNGELQEKYDFAEIVALMMRGR